MASHRSNRNAGNGNVGRNYIENHTAPYEQVKFNAVCDRQKDLVGYGTKSRSKRWMEKRVQKLEFRTYRALPDLEDQRWSKSLTQQLQKQ